MKYLDKVKVIVNRPEYEKYGVYKDMVGEIIMSEIRYNKFEVVFFDENGQDFAYVEIYVGDLELVEDFGMTDEDILEDLPKHDPHWWCKVENGYILNLLGEKKNKIAYDSES